MPEIIFDLQGSNGLTILKGTPTTLTDGSLAIVLYPRQSRDFSSVRSLRPEITTKFKLLMALRYGEDLPSFREAGDVKLLQPRATTSTGEHHFRSRLLSLSFVTLRHFIHRLVYSILKSPRNRVQSSIS